MYNRKTQFYIFLLLLFALAGCVQIHLRTANENYEQFAYAPAAQDYEYYLHKKQDDQAIINIADCYYQMGNSVKTEYWYTKAIKLPEAKPEFNLFLGEALMKNGKYEEAKKYLSTYIELNSTDLRATRLLNSCNNPDQFKKDTTLYNIMPLRMNTPGQNYFSPTYYRSGIVFLSDRPYKGLSTTKSDGTGKRFLDLFYAKKTEFGNWIDPEPLRGDVNGRFNEGPAVFSRDYNTMYFTRNNYVSNVIEKNKRNINVLKIYKAEVVEGEWLVRGEMYFNSGDYSVGHPALNKDGTMMYFSSDMAWGYGGTDIYSVQWQGNNNWSQPVNIGTEVNTEGNELFPFLPNDSTLYFASDGLEGMGGLDIFESHLVNGKWSEPLNLGMPINSSMDDFGFIVDSTGINGYFSSNRNGNEDRIYSFVKNPPKLIIEIKVVDDFGVAVNKTMVKVKQPGARDTVFNTDASGIIRFAANPGRQYFFGFDNPDYFLNADSVSTIGKRYSETVKVNVRLKKVELNKPVVWKGIDFKKKDWQLKLTSGDALTKLVTLLQDNPRLQVEIGAYTDSRGTDEDNLALTQRRAELVVQYLSSQGIKASRLTATGYGETKLLNKCVNNIMCIEEEHAINNRVEIMVKSISKDTAFR